MKTSRRLLLFLSVAALLVAQNPVPLHRSTAPTHSATSRATSITDQSVISGGVISIGDGGGGWATSNGNVVWSTGGSSCWILTDGTSSCSPSTQYETRTLDGKGPTLQQVDYSAKPLDAAELAPARYIETARAAGVDGPSIEEAQMLAAIHELDLHVYNWAKVDQYLYRKALTEGTMMRWVWKPVRSQDLKAANASGWGFKEGSGFLFKKLYAQRLPLRILARIKQIQDCEPEAIFLVSDYEVVKPDPFLAITTKQLLDAGKIWIVDRWDEPTFNDGTELDVRASR